MNMEFFMRTTASARTSVIDAALVWLCCAIACAISWIVKPSLKSTVDADDWEKTEGDKATQSVAPDENKTATHPLLNERRIVLVFPHATGDDTKESQAAAMLGEMRFPFTTVSGDYKRLHAKYEIASGGNKHFPQVFVEDYHTGDQCEFVPEPLLDQIAGYEILVRQGLCDEQSVPQECRVSHIFHGVRTRPRGMCQAFKESPMKPMDLEILAIIRNVPLPEAHEEAAKKTATATLMEERLQAKKITKLLRALERHLEVCERALEERERAENDAKRELTLMVEEAR